FAAATGEAIRQLEEDALARRPAAFVDGLERFLRVSAATAERIVDDQTGEPLIVAAKALGIPSAVLLRILLFLHPVIGDSVDRVFDLVDLYEQLSTEAALHLVSSWQGAVTQEKRTAHHQPLHYDDETRAARRTFDHARRVSPQSSDSRLAPRPERAGG